MMSLSMCVEFSNKAENLHNHSSHSINTDVPILMRSETNIPFHMHNPQPPPHLRIK
jgi:hypothetical protein